MTRFTSHVEGHRPTLIAAFLHFDLSFMLWVLLGALGIFIAESAGLSAAQKGLVVAVPLLSGSLLRVPIGLLSDRFGGTRVGALMLAFLFVPLTIGWRAGDSLSSLVAIGLMLGTAGASFAVALPLASRWYPPERQGLVMGIAAAGNSGTVITNLVAPRLAEAVGWHSVLGLAMLPLAAVLVAFVLMARDAPRPARPLPMRGYLRALEQSDIWWFCVLYSVTFGGYVGLGSFLPILFRDQYQFTPIAAGYATAAAAFAGSVLRPLGGYLADRFGGTRVLSLMLLSIAGIYALASRLPDAGTMLLLLVVGMSCLGMGNGAVFQLVPQRFAREIGVATGLIGAIGGLGGFCLPMLLGTMMQTTGSFRSGFVILAAVAAAVLLMLQALVARRSGWRASWRDALATGV
jgi:NNP family nitrate/nitrite transporter-like MFS transporter